MNMTANNPSVVDEVSMNLRLRRKIYPSRRISIIIFPTTFDAMCEISVSGIHLF